MVNECIKKTMLSVHNSITFQPLKMLGRVLPPDKKGWIRIAEACISILIVLAMLLIMTRSKGVDPRQDLTASLPPILDEIAKTEAFREKILSNDPTIQRDLDAFVKARLPQLGVDFQLLICKTTDPCTPPSPRAKDVYTAERIISSALNQGYLPPKRLRLFVWR